MKIYKTILFSVLPFAVYSVFHSLVGVYYLSDPDFIGLASIICTLVLASIVVFQVLLKDTLYFPGAVLIAVAVITGMLNGTPVPGAGKITEQHNWMNIVLNRPQIVLYTSLLIMASIPQIAGGMPFTVYFAKQGVPEQFQKTALFRKVNVYISNFWAFLFAVSIAAQFLPGLLLQILVPVSIHLFIGAPATGFLKPYLIEKFGSKVSEENRDFLKTAYDAVTGMPFIFNKKAAEYLELVFQFRIYGDEEFEGYIHVADGRCQYHDGRHPSPTLTINSPADIYLKISKNEMNGRDAFLKRLYSMEGDLSAALLLDSIFKSGNSDSPIKPQDQEKPADEGAGKSFPVGRIKMKPGGIKKVLAIAGSPRNPETSKTDILTQAFLKGCRNAGAEVETVYLSRKNINHCTGCYTCWTKTPGVCVFKDDAAEIMTKEENADLVVYASPLYHYGIISIMKKYIERTLPRIKPYLVDRGDGKTTHPIRDGHKEDIYAVIISVCGFPEVSHFGAFSANFHYLADSRGEHGINILAELYRPFSETLNNPFYRNESDRVIGAAVRAGEEIVNNGFIRQALVDEIAKVNVDISSERETSNNAWDLCIEKKITMTQFQDIMLRGDPL